MIAVSRVQTLREQIKQWRRDGLKIGFVPTMGNLHQGHLGLVDIAKQQADRVVVSIFVNPLQFGEGEDFARYPRTLDQDQIKLQSQRCDLLFCPSVEELYPSGAISTRVQADPELAALWEGAARPGHFDGVCTVVAKLFNLVQPDLAIFGQKDFQQWTIIKRMVVELNWPVELVKAPIARDQDGLALSSRNQYLSVDQRQIAPKLYVVLQDAAMACFSGNADLSSLCQTGVNQLLSLGFDQVDYFSIVDPTSLKPLTQLQDSMTLIAVARLGGIRLLDNIEINLKS
ncbi:pantoate--beta-alanine ligase [Thiomicrospira microaerophila]|uniref:pantoate--beta-alanine ligase n=1 Tax=Thiomicrospira microaerophila TaxID=406020 RepID=UPI00200DCF1C|nr:pantoate--beta-alanine ligase [Thiomicrospira microaerophila]UQB41750.1 pantoate--beta-alanine ligase [Thiomicrospira microaerophila]